MPRRTKLLASTALEICFWPRRLKYSATWPVLGAIVMLRRTWAVKRPQRVGASMATGNVGAVEGGADSSEMPASLRSASGFGRDDAALVREDASLMRGERGRL